MKRPNMLHLSTLWKKFAFKVPFLQSLEHSKDLKRYGFSVESSSSGRMLSKKTNRYRLAALLDLTLLLIILFNVKSAQRLINPLISPLLPLQSLTEQRGGYEVFGFAPYFNFDKLDNIDFNVLTTLAYFGVDVNSDGSLDKAGTGYQTYHSQQATDLFKKAHSYGTRVVLTLTQMNDSEILALMDDPDAQKKAIDSAVKEVNDRGIDGINVDFEYSGDPGDEYRKKFSNFIANLTSQMHRTNPASKVTVSVYASAIKDPKIYDIASLSKSSDGIFMMAYDFAVAGSDNAIPTSPLYGYKDGKYWYDVSTAVDDFLTQMDPSKLILGVPYYGYNYAVDSPTVKAATYYSGKAEPYSVAETTISPNMDGVDDYKTGWDSEGMVGWVAYHMADTGVWRMLFLDDAKSLSLKYDFAKSKNLEGVGIWALGFDQGKSDLWSVLASKFGNKVADSSVANRVITEVYADGN